MLAFSPVAWRRVAGGGGAAWAPPQVGGQNPTLHADFANNQYWALAAIQPSFAAWMTAIGATYSRASTATYLQGGVVKTAAANTARFPTTLAGAPTGLRLTGAAINLHLQSSIGSSIASYTTANGTLTANVGPDPTGGSAAASFILNTASLPHNFFLSAGINITGGQTYTSSVFIKPTGPNIYDVVLDPNNALTDYATFNLHTGVVNSNVGTGVGAITALAGGWFLISVTATLAAGGNVVATVNGWNIASGNRSFAGDGVSGWNVWGLQYTNTAFQADYIPTTTATVTQAADSFSFPFTQTVYSALAGTNALQWSGTSDQRILDSSGQTPIFINLSTQFAVFGGSVLLGGPTLATDVSNPHKTMTAGNTTNVSTTSD
ncbi:MAG TPA: hypothetical protein VHT68_26495, partial [Pseudolabrys sp.]|nr:hypothetical protein [Pseudolabrys sp.]